MLDSNELIVIGDVTLIAPLGSLRIGGIELRTIAKRNGKALLNIYATPGLIERIDRVTKPSPQFIIVTRSGKTVDVSAPATVGLLAGAAVGTAAR